MNYKQIKDKIVKEIIVNRSKFISMSYRVSTLEQLNDILNELKVNYSDATHICYAYKLIDNNQIKEGYFESKEPKNTSGKQIYNLIESRNLINILIVVIRYYGGTKLGVGLLSRSYLNSSKLVVENDNLINWIDVNEYSLSINISEFEKILYLINKNNIEIVEKLFDNQFVKLKINLTKEQKQLDFLQKYINY